MQGRQNTQTIEIDDGDWITAPDVAKRLRMTTAWVYAQTRSGLIPHVTLGRYVRYRRSAINAWLKQIEVSAHTAGMSEMYGDSERLARGRV